MSPAGRLNEECELSVATSNANWILARPTERGKQMETLIWMSSLGVMVFMVLFWTARALYRKFTAVSYTHLTLPTIYSV